MVVNFGTVVPTVSCVLVVVKRTVVGTAVGIRGVDAKVLVKL